MRVVILGASGFIGRELVRELVAAGHAVIALSRNPVAAQRCFPVNVTVLDWREDADYVLPDGDAVVNLAGEPLFGLWTADKRRRIYSSRVDLTRSLVAAISRMESRPSLLLNASAIGYYGDRGDETLTEDSPPGDGFLAALCVDWEKEAMRAKDYGLNVACVRIGAVLDRDGGALEMMGKVFRLGAGGKLGSGRQWMSWIHRADLAAMMAYALEHPSLNGPVNGTAPEPVTNETLTRLLALKLRRPALFSVPEFALKLAMGDLGEFLLESQRVIPAAALASGYEFRHPTLAAALSDIYGP